MNWYTADLHIHTLTSPCGSLEMSPRNIVQAAKKNQLDIIGITDHNCTRQCETIMKLAAPEKIFVLPGAEITTKEEVHCLTFFEDLEILNQFQKIIEKHLSFVKNNPKLFGYQVVVDEEEQIVEEIEGLLISALDLSLEQLILEVRKLNGIVIPAHVNKPSNSLISQLGFIPGGQDYDALEIFLPAGSNDLRGLFESFPKEYSLVMNSDAHFPQNIGQKLTRFKMKDLSFREICLSLRKMDGREVKI